MAKNADTIAMLATVILAVVWQMPRQYMTGDEQRYLLYAMAMIRHGKAADADGGMGPSGVHGTNKPPRRVVTPRAGVSISLLSYPGLFRIERFLSGLMLAPPISQKI
jgi:hypothetical protein